MYPEFVPIYVMLVILVILTVVNLVLLLKGGPRTSQKKDSPVAYNYSAQPKEVSNSNLATCKKCGNKYDSAYFVCPKCGTPRD